MTMGTALSPAQRPAATRVRLDYLHGLRGLAALCVAIGHAAQLCTGTPAIAPVLRVFTYPSGLAVPTFIVLSGYCLALPVVQTGTLASGPFGFLLRRARRILPAYYAAILFSLLVALFLTHTVAPSEVLHGAPSILGPLLLLHDLWGPAQPHAYDVPLWSLAIEWHIYFCFPFLVALWRRLGALPAGLLAIAGACLAIGPVSRVLPWVMPQFYALFAAGVLAAWIGHSAEAVPARLRSAARLWGVLAPSVLALYVVWLLGAGWDAFIGAPVRFELGWGVVCVALLVRCAAAPSPLARRLGSRPLHWMGERSYSLYLVHWPLLCIAARTLVPYGTAQHWPALVLFAAITLLAVPASLLLAAAFYRRCEAPFLRARARPVLWRAGRYSFQSSRLA